MTQNNFPSGDGAFSKRDQFRACISHLFTHEAFFIAIEKSRNVLFMFTKST